MKFIKLKGIFFALSLFFLPIFGTSFVLNDDGILNAKVSAKLNEIGSELKSKTGVTLTIGVFEKTQKSLTQLAKNLSTPYIFLVLIKEPKQVEILADEQSLKLFNKEQVLSPFPQSGTILPILTANNGKDVYNAALLNGYADIAEQVAKNSGVILNSAVGDANKNTINFFRYVFYLGIVLTIIVVLRTKRN